MIVTAILDTADQDGTVEQWRADVKVTFIAIYTN